MNTITFVLPTKNRPDKLFNFLNYHEKILRKIKYKIIIMDGSDSKIHKKIKKFIKNKKKIILFKQKKPGFMNACFESIKKIKTNYCTFLYDDDYLSPEIIKVYSNTLSGKFSMGFGQVEDYLNLNDFLKIKYAKYKRDELILGYYGKKIKKIKYFPVSPICMIFKSSILNRWKNMIISFCNHSNLRYEYFLKKNIGPDLLLYLLNITNEKQIYMFSPSVAKFSSHKSSMSFLLGINNLQVGYWLSKKMVLEFNLIKAEDIKKWLYNFLLLSGLYILLKNGLYLLINKKNIYTKFKKEILNLSQKNHHLLSIRIIFIIIFNKTILKWLNY